MKYLGPLYTPNNLPFELNNKPMGGFKKAEYIRTVDGDTAMFKVDNKIERVRFFVVNTKELHPIIEQYAMEAKQYTENTLKYAKTIYLQSDPADDLRDDTESHRLLAWIWVDYRLLNYLLVEKGYAEVKYVYSKKVMYLDDLYKAQAIAKSKKLRLYGEKYAVNC